MAAWITAGEAADRLGVKRATLYAYVSRGVLARRRSADGRGSLFDPREVDRLAARGRPRRPPGGAELVIESALTEITGDRLRYRGHEVTTLAATRTFEDVATLLWTGTLPGQAPGPPRPAVPGAGQRQAGFPGRAVPGTGQRQAGFAGQAIPGTRDREAGFSRRAVPGTGGREAGFPGREVPGTGGREAGFPGRAVPGAGDAVTGRAWRATPEAVAAGTAAQAALPPGALPLERLQVIVPALAAADPLRLHLDGPAVIAAAQAMIAGMVTCLPPAVTVGLPPAGLPPAMIVGRFGVSGDTQSSDDHEAGAPGVAGAAGVAGTRGVAGVPGVADVADVVNVAGTRSVAGVAGVAGAAGVAGVAGAADVVSVAGALGEAGVAGALGAAGVAGMAGIAGLLWRAICPRPAEPGLLAAVEAALVLLADHELAASTLAARVAASVRADPYAVVATGLGALGGPLHGGASLGAEGMLAAAETARDAPRVVGELLRRTGRVPGFGHFVYRTGDPRAVCLLRLVARAAPGSPRLAVADAVLAEMRRRALPEPNIDFALAVLADVAGMISGAGEAVFAVARTAGWIAHALEEYGRDTPLRPRAVYTGPPEQPAPDPAG